MSVYIFLYIYYLITFLVLLSLTYIYVLNGAISLQAMWIDYARQTLVVVTQHARLFNQEMKYQPSQ